MFEHKSGIDEMETPIRQYTTKQIISIDGDESIQNACKLMVELGIGSLAVVSDGKMVGFFTEGDVLRKVVAEGMDYNQPIKKMMTTKLITADIDTPVGTVLTTMSKNQIKHILIEDDGEIVGIFTLNDLIDVRKQWTKTSISSE